MRGVSSKNPLPSREKPLSVLAYDPETGVFTWKVSTGGIARGTRAGVITTYGYRVIVIEGRQYRAGRLAWEIMKGADPVGLVDHRDLRRDDKAESRHDA